MGKLLVPRKKMKSRWCSTSASFYGVAPARWRGFNGGGEDEAPPWLGVERERVTDNCGVNGSERESWEGALV